MDKLKAFVFERVRAELKNKNWSIKFFTQQILGKSETWLHNKIHERSKLTFKDLEIIAKGLNVSRFDLLPNRLKYDIDKMPLTDLIKKIVKNEIEHYLKENNCCKEETKKEE